MVREKPTTTSQKLESEHWWRSDLLAQPPQPALGLVLPLKREREQQGRQGRQGQRQREQRDRQGQQGRQEPQEPQERQQPT